MPRKSVLGPLLAVAALLVGAPSALAVAPVVTVGHPNGVTSDVVMSVSPQLTLTSDQDPGVGYECSTDDVVYAPCSSPYTYPTAGDGTYTLYVHGTNVFFETGSASRTFTLDTAAPVLGSLAMAPEHDPGYTKDPAPTFTWTNTEPGNETCQLDVVVVACSGSYTPASLADGPHSFRVDAQDAAGNPAAPLFMSFTVDTSAPTFSFAPSSQRGADPNATMLTTASWSVLPLEALDGAGLRCALDAGAYASCPFNVTLSGLSAGNHTLHLSGTDHAGNTGTDSTPLLVDLTAPTASIVSATPADGGYRNMTPGNDTATYGFTSGDASSGVASVTCTLDRPTHADVVDPSCTSTKSYGAAALDEDGLYTFTVVATDNAGNQSVAASRTFTVDTVAPALSALAMSPEHTSGFTNALKPAFTWTRSETVTETCTMDAGPAVPCATGWQPASNLSPGSHTLTIDAVDPAGNASNQLTKTFTVDTTAPTFTYGALSPQHGADPDATNQTSTGHPVAPSEPLDGAGMSCALDAGASAPCTSPVSYTGLSAGSHTTHVSGTDRAGNAGTGSHGFFVDLAPPAPTVDSGPTQPYTASTNATFTFSPHDPAPSSGLAGAECSLDGGAFTPCVSPTNYSGLAEGDHTFRVRYTDKAGNVATSAPYGWAVDLTDPQTTITGTRPGKDQDGTAQNAPTYATHSTTAAFSFSTTDPLSGGPPPVASGVANVRCSLDGGAFVGCPSNYTGLTHGVHTFRVRGTDNVGHVETVGPGQTWSWFVDLVAPDITLTYPYPNARFNYFKQDDDVLADYSCDDRQVLPGPTESGVATCTGTVPVGSPFDRTSQGAPVNDLTPRVYPFQIDTTDKVGNSRSTTYSYRVFTFAGLILDDHPEAYFRMNDPEGSPALDDLSGNGHDGLYKNATASGPVGISGDDDTARVFTGADGYGYVNDMPAPRSSYTMAAFVQFATGDDGMVMQHGRGGALFRRGDSLVFRQVDTDVVLPIPGGIVPGCWYFVAGRWDGATATVYAGTHDGDTDCTGDAAGLRWFAPVSAPSTTAPSGDGSTFYAGYGDQAPWLHGMLDEAAYFYTDIGATHVRELWLADPPPRVRRVGGTFTEASKPAPAASPGPAAAAPAAKPGAGRAAAKARVRALTKRVAKAKARVRALQRRHAAPRKLRAARRELARVQRALRAAKRKL